MFTDNLMVSKIISKRRLHIHTVQQICGRSIGHSVTLKKKIKLSTVSLFNVKEVISPFCTRFFPEFAKSDCVENYVKNNCTMAF